MKNTVNLFTAIFLLPGLAIAQSTESNNMTSDESDSDDTILVRTTPTSQSMGTQIIDRQQINNFPEANGNITGLLKHNPNVRFADSTDSSTTAGEIAPENVSFHGEKFYNNNFMIDGLSNNNTINPGANGGELTNSPDGYSPTDLPAGGTQSFWINSELVDRLEVFDSNISAKYGSFTGGVVDARLKDPLPGRASGKITYRTTRSAWTRYHIDSGSAADVATASHLTSQPQFTKQFYSVSVNQPLNDKAGIIFSYNRQQSVIPYYQTYLQQWDNQKRIAETYLLKGTYLADNGDTLRLTGMYSPHKSEYFKENVKNGAFTNTGGGYRLNGEWEHLTSWGKVTSLAGYQSEQNKISHQSDQFLTWYRYYTPQNFVSDAIDWSSSAAAANYQTGMIGGYGSYSTEKKTITLKQNYELNPLMTGPVQHQLDFGWETDSYSVQYQRFRDVTVSRGVATVSPAVVCKTGDDYCITGEQYFKNLTVYPARKVSANYTDYAAYFQDSISYGRLEMTPGVRLQYDDFLKNLTLAPRLAASYDVFDDHSTRFFGGANRYYGQNLLAYKLRNGISSYYTRARNSATGTWTDSGLKTAAIDYDSSSLKTPYSDELSLGISQRVTGTLWTVKWVNRQGKDQFGRETTTGSDGKRSYILANNARTRGDSISLTVEPVSPAIFSLGEIGWTLGASYGKTRSSSQSYYDVSDSDDNKAIYHGRLMDKRDMEALDFNTPWTAFINVNTYFPALRLNWNQNLGYTAGYRGYTTTTTSCPAEGSVCGDYQGSVTRYDETRYKDYFSYDWKLSYLQPLSGHQTLELSLDVINVLDNVIAATQTSSSGSSKTVNYKTGRQFWLGVAYSW
ncbi:TonB-dependent receptor plug domain-containing protein [Tatumella punctata]|uniref:TonB-dependent receptor plug domain-containing protein n=1 Tax=Tatumella punctata TaxID=399969 RepID=A0ABW1VTA3_9GAMM